MAGLNVSFWVLPAGGTPTALPDVRGWEVSPVAGGTGAFKFDYPAHGRNFALLRSIITDQVDLDVHIRVDGTAGTALGGIIFTAEGDDVVEGAVWSFTGHFNEVLTTEIVVAYNGAGENGETALSGTPGSIIATLMFAAHGRGTDTLAYGGFTDMVDSNGTAWPTTITSKSSPGRTYYDILQTLARYGHLEWEVTAGRELRLYVPGTRGIDRTLTDPPVTLQAGRDLADAPRRYTVRDAGTVLLAAGAEGLTAEAADATALARRGRRIERFQSFGSAEQQGTLAALTQAQVAVSSLGSNELSGRLQQSPAASTPFIDFGLADWVFAATSAGRERLAVAQLTVTGDQDGVTSAAATLGSLIEAQAVRAQRQIDGLTSGEIIAGTSTPAPDTDPGRTPNAPAGLTGSSIAYTDDEGTGQASVTAGWSAVTTNTDSTAIFDLSGYEVQFRYTGGAGFPTGWITAAGVSAQQVGASWAPVAAGQGIELRVKALNRWGRESAWSAGFLMTTAADNVPPPVPSAPVVSPRVGQLLVEWDGLGAVGEAMPSDFDAVEVHVSESAVYTPGPTTLFDRMAGSRATVYTDGAYGTSYYFRFVSVDRSGNRSGPSGTAQGRPQEIGFGDIAFTQVGNLVEDGSFELAGSRATHLTRSDTPAWSMVEGGGADLADHGGWYARATGAAGSGFRGLHLSGRIATTPTQQYAYRLAIRGTGVNGDLSARIRWYDKAGVAFQDNSTVYTPAADATGAWVGRQAPAYTAPALAESFEVVIEVHDTCTAGTWDVDRVEVRDMIGTLLVQNAAITNAKIADLAVGKLTAGTITAVMLMAGELRTAADPAARVVINSAGFRKYDAANALRVEITDAVTRIDGEITVGDASSQSNVNIGVGAASQRANITTRDVNGELTTVLGQSYNQETGLPATNGLIVTRDNPLRNILRAVGSGETIGVEILRSDEIEPRSALRVRAGLSDHLRVKNTDGSIAYLGQISSGATNLGQGLLVFTPAGDNVIETRQGLLLYRTRIPAGGSGAAEGTVHIATGGTYAHIGFVEGTRRWGFEFSTRSRIRSDVRADCVDTNVTTFQDFEVRDIISRGQVLTNSTAAGKRNFRPLPASGLSAVRGAPVVRWQRVGQPDAEPQMGPVLEDLPAWLQVTDPDRDEPGAPSQVSLMSMIGTLWDAVRELDTELDELRQPGRRPDPAARRSAPDLLDDIASGRIRSAVREFLPPRTDPPVDEPPERGEPDTQWAPMMRPARPTRPGEAPGPP